MKIIKHNNDIKIKILFSTFKKLILFKQKIKKNNEATNNIVNLGRAPDEIYEFLIYTL